MSMNNFSNKELMQIKKREKMYKDAKKISKSIDDVLNKIDSLIKNEKNKEYKWFFFLKENILEYKIKITEKIISYIENEK